MPTLPVYIRVDDLDKWKALDNKAEFIHNALNPTTFVLDKSKLGTPKPAISVMKRKTSPEEFQTFFKKGKK